RRLWPRDESATEARARRNAVFGRAPYLRPAFPLYQRAAVSDLRPIAGGALRGRHLHGGDDSSVGLLAVAAADGTRARSGGDAQRDVALRLQASRQLHAALLLLGSSRMRAGAGVTVPCRELSQATRGEYVDVEGRCDR